MSAASTTDARNRNKDTKKVVISERFGGFGISQAAANYMGLDPQEYHRNIERTDPKLVQAVESLGADASDRFSNLVVVEIPADMAFHIHEYDGFETVHEDHRTYASTGLEDGGSC